MEKEYDLPELLKGSVGSIAEKLDGMTRVQLQTLHALEKGRDNARSTLLAAIDKALEGKPESDDPADELDSEDADAGDVALDQIDQLEAGLGELGITFDGST